MIKILKILQTENIKVLKDGWEKKGNGIGNAQFPHNILLIMLSCIIAISILLSLIKFIHNLNENTRKETHGAIHLSFFFLSILSQI